MQYPVFLPNVELNMEGVSVSAWLVKVGEVVAAEQPLMEVETQKATVEVPAPQAGYVRALYVNAGDEVAEKALLCVLTDEADEAFSDPREPAGAPTQSAAAEMGEVKFNVADDAASDDASTSGPVMASPAARKLARELGVDLGVVKGSGPGGRISPEDVQAAAKPNAAASTVENGAAASREVAAGEWTTLPASRLALNAQMQKSLGAIPQITVARQMDVTFLAQKAEGVTFTHRLVQALARTLQKHSQLRCVIEGERVRAEPVSVAVAMDTPHGLVAPAVRGADAMTLEQIAATVKDFQARGQSNGLRREELVNAPFAITNLGMLGVDFFQPFVFFGQTAVLAVGRATDGIGGRKAAWFNLAVDHRIVDGAEAARFLQTLQEEIFAA